MAGIVGVVVGFPALRIKGIYLLLLTLGFAEIISVIALSWDYVGGAQGFRQHLLQSATRSNTSSA